MTESQSIFSMLYGRPLKSFKDCIKVNIAHAGIRPELLEDCSHDQTGRRALMYEAMGTFEANRRSKMNQACAN